MRDQRSRGVLFHLATREDWERAGSAPAYTTPSLDDAGFIEPRAVRFDAPGANGAVIARKP